MVSKYLMHLQSYSAVFNLKKKLFSLIKRISFIAQTRYRATES